MGEVLVIYDQFQTEAFLQAGLDDLVQSRQHPGGQAVRVDGDGDRLVRRHPAAEFARGIGAQGLQLTGKAQQDLAGLGQTQRPRTYDQQLAKLRLQAAQALRNRALRDRKQLSGALEAALIGQRGEAIQPGGIDVFHKPN